MIFCILSRRPFLPFPTSACSRTSLKVDTGIISILFLYLSSIRTSLIFESGIKTFLIPASAAASILPVTPPTGRTSPLTLNEPVSATDWSTGMFSRDEITAVATETLALSPSTPSYACRNCMCIS